MAKTAKHPSKHLVVWGSLDFHVQPRDIIGVKDLSFTGSCETEEKESGGEKYASYKTGKPIEFSMTAKLNAYLTDNVQQKALEMVKLATRGEKHYLYMSRRKLFPSQFTLVSAKIGNIVIAAGGKWVSCEVDLSFKQASKYDGSEAPATSSSKSSGGGAKKGTVRPASAEKVTVPLTNYQKAQIRQANQQTQDCKLAAKVEAKRSGKLSGGGLKWTAGNAYR
jgi:hypothetical protein